MQTTNLLRVAMRKSLASRTPMVRSHARSCFRHLTTTAPLVHAKQHAPTTNSALFGALLATGAVLCLPEASTVAKSESPAQYHSKLTLADEMYDHPENYSRAELLELMEQMYESKQHDPEVMWRLARALYEVSLDKDLSKEEKKSLTERAYNIVEEATKVDPKNFAAQKWGGILLTAIGDFESTKVRIGNSYRIKDYFLTASKLNPNDPNSHHLLGRWAFAIASISWVERKAAELIFGTPPKATYEEALDYFLHAETIEPNFWKKNLVMIGNCYLKLNEKEKAKEYFERSLILNIETEEDQESHDEATKALSKL